MKLPKEELPARIDSGGTVARHQPDFGDATGYGDIAAEYFTIPEGADLGPLLEGLEGDLCQSPHWGYMISGVTTATFDDGSEEVLEAGDVFYMPPGHTARTDEETEMILFSPQEKHGEVIEHIRTKMAESG